MAEPKYLKIKTFITQNIESGAWPAHSKVPSENELADQHGVSRMTARRALQELTDSGVLNRTQGAGTFVAELKSQSSLFEIHNIADEIAERGHSYKGVQISNEAVPADSTVAQQLNIDENIPVFKSVLIHYEESLPIQLEVRFVNTHLIPNYLAQDFTQITPHEYLCAEAPLTEASHIIEAVMPDKDIADLLNLTDSEPCLKLTRRTWSKKGVVSYALLYYPGSRYRLGGHLKF